VRPVGVHLDHHPGAAVQRDPEPVEVRAAQALLPGPVVDVDPRVVRREAVGQVAGPIGRAVVDDEQRGPGEGVEDGGRDRLEVLALVVGREDDPGAGADGVRGGLGRDGGRDGVRDGRIDVRAHRGPVYGRKPAGRHAASGERGTAAGRGGEASGHRVTVMGMVVALRAPARSVAATRTEAAPGSPARTVKVAL
jgi:hypothetical protein